jgi:hypothetical protein
MQHKPLWQQHYDKCTHFNGTIHDACDAGILYQNVRGVGVRGFVCFRDEAQNAPSCSQSDFPTEEESHAYEDESRTRSRAFFAEMDGGTCPHCHQAMTKTQVGHCVYAEPCGHRLYQGTIGKA